VNISDQDERRMDLDERRMDLDERRIHGAIGNGG
jgi:hypothetical protein